MKRRRIDLLLVERGLVESLQKAQALVLAGSVSANGRPIEKAGALVPEGAEINLLAPPRYVSRGGVKLEHALREFRLDVTGWAVADLGAATGGFTDCLLQHGAKRVYAVDVGYGLLDYRLRHDPRVVLLEHTNARYLTQLPEPVDLVTMDLSFISVEKVVPAAVQLFRRHGWLLLLFKPQFQAERREVGKGGLIKDPQVHARVLGRFIVWALDFGLRLRGLTPSPLLGASGNKEFLLLLEYVNQRGGDFSG